MPITTPRASLVSIRPRSILKIYLEAKKVVTPKILPSSEATDAPPLPSEFPVLQEFFWKTDEADFEDGDHHHGRGFALQSRGINFAEVSNLERRL